jgi:transcriptional regulator with XRE-family HTH domain
VTDHLEQPIGPRSRSLAPLKKGLREDERVFAEHLRDLRERTGLTSADLAAKLSVDPTRLSRYLSGQSLPEPQLLTRLHQLLASPDAEPVVEAARNSRALLYAAARAKGPLSARAYEVAEIQERMDEQQASTARSLAALQAELEHERDQRRHAELEIEQLRQAGAEERDEQIRRLESERDSALRRVAELEDLVAQTGALLRLQQDDAQHVKEMAQATEGELQRWENDDMAPGAAGWELLLLLGDETTMTCEQTADTLAELRDAGRDDEADEIILKISREASPAAVTAFYSTLVRHRRRLDADRLLKTAASQCDAVRLRQLVMGGPVLYEKTYLPESWDDRYEEVMFNKPLLSRASTTAPVEELARLVRSFVERGERELLKELVPGASFRSRAERRKLQSAGLSFPRSRDKVVDRLLKPFNL